MKIKYLAAAAAVALPALMQAVPADPRVRTLLNPDGTSIEVRVHGDEFFNFMTDADRTLIIEKDARGFYVPAMRGGKVIEFNRENVEEMRAQALAENPAFAEAAVETRGASSMQRMASLDGSGRSNYPTIGNGNKSLVVLVEFSDQEFTVENPKEYFTRQLNEPGFSDYGGVGSALDYYRDSSNGLYTPQFDVYGPVKVSHKASYFSDLNSGRMGTLINEAVTALHESGELNLADYDFDEDGTVDTVFFYYAGYGQADSGTKTIWPHQSDYQTYVRWFGSPQLRLDGKRIGPYACANELAGFNPETNRSPWADGSTPWVVGIGTFCHEYGHVLGLPDLYDVDYNDSTIVPGKWDIMCAGSYNFNSVRPPLFSSYEQWMCRWLEYTDAEDATHYDLAALGNSDNPTAVRIRIPQTQYADSFYDEYFLIEARDNSKWDSCFPNPGLMIWRINYKKSLWNNNSVNSSNGSNVEIIYADGDNNPLYDSGCIYPGSPNELIPSTKYQWWTSPFITDMSYDGEAKTGKFDYNVITEAPTGSTVLHDNPYADPGSSRNFTLEWDAVEGADAYLLTIKRVSTGKYLGLYNDFNLGNETKHKVMSVVPGFWNNEIEAYVRVVKNGIPCSDISNIVTFVPKDLPKGNGGGAVDGIESDNLAIFGGNGCITAPEGAVAYSLSGTRVAMDGLAPGIYVVIYNSEAVKVTVR